MTSNDILMLCTFIIIVMGIPFLGAVLIDYVAKRFKRLTDES